METASNKEQQVTAIEELCFSDALKQLVSDLTLRSQEIIFTRYGVFNSHAMTLEEIGKKYSITRERVRQVIREVLKKIREKKQDPIFLQTEKHIVLALEKNNGIMEESQLLAFLGKNDTSQKAAVSFFLECIDSIESKEIKGELLFSYAKPEFDLENWRAIKNIAIASLKNKKKPLSLEELFDAMKAEVRFPNFSKEILASFLAVSEEIRQNTFEKYGIAKWKEISPKGTREKAYLVLKEAAEPLHFRDIAKKIDKYHLNKKKTHPQTVHNELIKDKNFVLVGRGIYALVEWGYKKGTVKDVIEEILKKAQKPLSREEVLNKVLEIRHVKKSTIVINLNNYFSKNKGGVYSIK